MECEGIGPDRAEAIAEWFADEDNQRLVAELRALGLKFEADEDDRPVEGPLTGKQYVVTGTLESFSREQAREALEALGAKVSDNVSKKTAGVIVGESPRLEGHEGGEGGRPAAHRGRPGGALLEEADASALANRSCARSPERVATGRPFWSTANAKRSPT